MKATDPCPHGSIYGKCMNGDCIDLRVQDKVKGVAEMNMREASIAATELRRGLAR